MDEEKCNFSALNLARKLMKLSVFVHHIGMDGTGGLGLMKSG